MSISGGKLKWVAALVVALVMAAMSIALGAGPAAAAPGTGTSTTATTATTSKPTAPPPANDARDNAQALGALPVTATGTTVGSTLESAEPSGECNRLAGSVWYSVSFGASVPATAGLSVRAGGQLDACVDVFVKDRSQDSSVTGADTDSNGLARLTFSPEPKTTYLIRVGQRGNSDPGPFSLQLFSVAASASAPGAPLPAVGGHGRLDSFFTTTAAYSSELTAAVTYKINLVNPAGGCMGLDIYGPGTTDFGSNPVAGTYCTAYRLFTPTQTGRYSFLVHAAGGVDSEQPFTLHVQAASSLEMGPGVALGNLGTVHGRLRGNVDTVVRLYRVDVGSTSQLTLALSAQSFSDFGLELLNSHGRQIQCACDNSGDETVQVTTRPGTYYAAVRAENFSYGKFTLTRQSRTITRLHVAIDGRGATHTADGTADQITAHISPAVDGKASFVVEYFDPLSGWQYRGTYVEPLSDGTAGFSFTPPEPGRWRTTASFAGTRTAAPADSGFAQVLVAPPAGE